MRKTLVIAEAGVNHNGDLNLAKKLIDVASEAGADYVKFQTFKTELCISKNAQKAEYQLKTTSKIESQFEMVKKLELSKQAHEILMEYCKERNIKFLSTAFDLKSIDLLVELGIDIFKIPSGEITNLPYLRKIAQLNKKIILSTGMATLGEIEKALGVLVENGTEREKIIILHCNTEYPTPFEDVNLKAMKTIKEAFKLPVGYSDHTLGITIPIAAVSMGACVIEKHFTLDKAMRGPDHLASLEPSELKAMIKAIRELEKAFGDGIKKPSKSESKNINIGRKSLVAIGPIKKGDLFTESNLGIKRPGNGISPMEWDNIIGKIATRDFDIDELIVL
ncbi:N-acetylneuraminate synthase [Campylobacter coli]|uniref:N-acetylneuraminate synthase n=1 Tax=Campylobacter coli TaxID=195 RepID=UPI000257D1A6|nr:N-acetylneuraminate synthase [Campylobacter coli]EIA70226.1 flagellin modification protein PtmC, putative N-acetylneuraminic acid synthetase [Campylobacter coli 7--1]EIA89013.1 flagellin modification protein PtmC, putative N-acetylneuraminic acid synthetase [Campylobacter coli 67-8]APA59234.1 N-acetylneuraminate synthase [Campylobacter coli]APA60376.1 N-acetylneuraminate synthase [Campylobacter coli]EAC2163596.1 N-acetylneuraminate synthase [Campylobacter coli]